jgi:hypothetical protein
MYLDKKGFEYIRSIYPSEKDWTKSPFSKLPKFKFSFVLIQINGTFVSWTNRNYLIITGQQKDKIQEFWLEIVTTYFQKPNLSFREGRLVKYKESDINKDGKFVNVGEKCPACGFKLISSDRICPDCGLNFE